MDPAGKWNWTPEAGPAGLDPPEPGTSFPNLLPVPTAGPFDSPVACVAINVEWVLLVTGCLQQLWQAQIWDVSTPSALEDIMEQVDALIGTVGNWEPCFMDTVSVTIAMGAATGSTAVTFASPFSAAPVVLVSADSGDVIASWESVSTTGFTARITSNTALPTALTATVSWSARLAV